MTQKKKGLFSKFKDKFSKKEDEDLDYEDIESEDELEDDEEYEYEDEDEDDEETIDLDDAEEYEDEHDEEVEYTQEQESTQSELEEDNESESIEEILEREAKEEALLEEDDEDEEYEQSENTIEFELPDSPKAPLLARVKGIFSKKPKLHDESEDEDDDFTEERFDASMASKARAFTDKLNISEVLPEQVIPTLVGKTNQEFIHQSFLVVLTCVSFYTVGKTVALWTSNEKPSSKLSTNRDQVATYSPRKDVSVIKVNNIFNVRESEFEKVKVVKEKKPEIKVCKEAEKKTALPMKLLNTIVLQDSVKSVASVSERGKVFSYREGDKIGTFAEIGKIDRLKMVFKNLRSGQCEFLENVDPAQKKLEKKKISVVSPSKGKKLLDDAAKKEIAVDGNSFTIKKGLRDKLLSNIGDVLTQARAIQIKNPDGTLSFKMTEIVPGSIFANLNIMDGDIVNGINGKKINNVNELMSMFGKLKENDSYEITVNRNGMDTNLNYNFVE